MGGIVELALAEILIAVKVVCWVCGTYYQFLCVLENLYNKRIKDH